MTRGVRFSILLSVVMAACAVDAPDSVDVEASSSALTAAATLPNSALTKEMIAKVLPANLDATVASLGTFNTRYYRSPTGAQASSWLLGKWRQVVAAGASPRRITVEEFKHVWGQSSLIATIPGTTTSADVWIVSAHLDSINSSSPLIGRAPGADNGASGAAALTETLRILASAAYKPQTTIKIIAYSATTAGFVGSSTIATSWKSAGVKVAGLLDLGIVGFPSSVKPDIGVITDASDATQNAFIKTLITNYAGVPAGDVTCGYACADHASWSEAGFKASAVFESTNLEENSHLDTATDTVVNARHIARFVNVALGYLAEKTRITR